MHSTEVFCNQLGCSWIQRWPLGIRLLLNLLPWYYWILKSATFLELQMIIQLEHHTKFS
jgi:hypothetical protein